MHVPTDDRTTAISALPNGYFSDDWNTFQHHAVHAISGVYRQLRGLTPAREIGCLTGNMPLTSTIIVIGRDKLALGYVLDIDVLSRLWWRRHETRIHHGRHHPGR